MLYIDNIMHNLPTITFKYNYIINNIVSMYPYGTNNFHHFIIGTGSRKFTFLDILFEFDLTRFISELIW